MLWDFLVWEVLKINSLGNIQAALPQHSRLSLVDRRGTCF